MGVLDQMLQNLVNMEFFQLLFPFLLALAISYGIMSVALKGKMHKSAMGLIAIIISFFVMLYSSWEPGLFYWLTNVSGVWLLVGSALLFLVIILGLLGIKPEMLWGDQKNKWVIAVIIIIIIYILVAAIWGTTPFGFSWGFGYMFDSQVFTIIFFIIVLAIVMWFLTREGEAPKKQQEGGG